MKKFSFVINGNDYEVEILGFEENTAHVEVNGTLFKRGGQERSPDDENPYPCEG